VGGCETPKTLFITVVKRHHDTKHKDTKHEDTGNNELICDTQHKWHSAWWHTVFSVIMLSVWR